MDRLATSKEAASGGDVTPTYQDALEDQIPSSMDISNALNSYLQSRAQQATGNINPPAQTPNENDFNELTLILPRTEVDRQSREIKNLGPVNCPGISELAPLKPTRSRSPSYQKAKTIYEEALYTIRKELDAFQNFEITSSEIVPDTEIRTRYRKLKMREIVLISVSEDLAPLLKRSGLVEEEKRISDEVMAIHNQVSDIKLTYQDVVSNVTNSILGDRDMEDIELTSTPETKQYSTNGWNCSTMTEAV